MIELMGFEARLRMLTGRDVGNTGYELAFVPVDESRGKQAV